mgnify:CR=1 FL=1
MFGGNLSWEDGRFVVQGVKKENGIMSIYSKDVTDDIVALLKEKLKSE